MSEEVKAPEEAQAETAAPAEEQAPEKPKKVNAMSKEQISKKIKELEEKNETGSKFYQHLTNRKAELEA